MDSSSPGPELKTKVVRGIELPVKQFPNAEFYLTSLVPDNFVEHCKYLKDDFIVRDDDVYICTYPRSGTNWSHEITRMLLNGKSDYVELFSFLEILPAEQLESMPSPRVLCSHLPYSFLPSKITEKAKLIYVSRNPKDVVVSLHNVFKNISFIYYNASWEDFLQLFIDGEVPYGNWFDHTLGWEEVIKEIKSPSILTLQYEDLKSQLVDNVEKISRFLELPYDPELFTSIANKCEFKNLYREKTTNPSDDIARLSKNTSNNLYRKGEIGDWKNWFTVTQNELFDALYEKRMKNSSLKYRFS